MRLLQIITDEPMGKWILLQKILVFVEVKSRKNRAFGNPIDAVNPVKQKRLQFMARQYMAERELCHVNVRFDIIEILWGDTAKQAVKIHHVKNAF